MRRFLVVILMLIFSFTGLISQETKIVNGYKVARGERPTINLDKIPVDSYEPGKLTIKVKSNISNKIEGRFIKPASKGYVETGIASFDLINKSIGAQLFDRKFNALLEIPGQHSVAKYADRHRAWGFDRVFEITIDVKQDVIAAVKQYAALEDVEYAEPVYKKKLHAPEKNGVPITDNYTSEKGDTGSKWTPSDPDLQPEQWHYENTGQTINGRVGVAGVDCRAYEAWDIETGNPDFIVAIVDQGIQYDHPDIAANMWSGLGWDFGANDATIEPDYHGTHVAGTVAAVTNNGIGVAGLAGGDGTANSGAKLMSCQVFGPVTGGFDLAMIWAADQGASISQNSWGYTTAGYFEQPTLDAIDYFNANGGGAGLQGGITIFASGNDNELETERYPGYYSGAMAVAGHDNQGKRYYNSNTGDYVEICAPAVDVHSTWINSGYDAITGTSMACPHVSGAAAMIVSNTEGVLTAPELRFILSESVWDIYQYETDPQYAGKLGPGALDASAALTLAQTYLGGVPTASNLASSGISTTEIDLSWELNEFNDNVLVAWALDGQAIGDPIDQIIYSVGNTLPGGGEIIYYNNSTTYSHTSLIPETGYDYKIWSRAGAERQDNQGEWYQEGTYSAGRTSGAETLTPPISPSAASLGFENSGSIPNGWSQEGDWVFVTTSTNPTSPVEGSYFANFNGTTGAIKKLVTPRFDLTTHTGISLDFNYVVTYRKQGNNNHYYDKLKIYYKTSSTGSWVQLGSEYSGDYSSWQNGSLSISDAVRTNDFYFAFEGIDESANGVSVDNIVINGTPSGGPVTPAVPANIVTSISDTDLVLDWDVSADATGYAVYSSDDPYGTFTFVTSVGTNQYTVAADQAKLFYYIVATNATK